MAYGCWMRLISSSCWFCLAVATCALGKTAASRGLSLDPLRVALNPDQHGRFDQTPFVRLYTTKCDCKASTESFGGKRESFHPFATFTPIS
ncbi:hypothetical protein EDB84DRAFT_1516444 [Lactarius hengduanensis]|nr:hypothetical protein EDB84DRAFT_1516444 [Lactarius hengduanensis]